jgi:hypothetical protein
LSISIILCLTGRSTDYLCQIRARNLTPSKNNIRICLLGMQRIWTRTAFWNLNNKKWSKWCILFSHLLFNNCFGSGRLVYMCSQWAPIIQIKYFMFDFSISSLFVLNTVWKHDSLPMMISVYVCWTCSVVELKTLFETWKARNDVNGVYWFHHSYLITVLELVIMLKSAHNGHQVSKSSIVYAIVRYTDYL